MKQAITALRNFFFLTLLLGFAYPLLMTGVAKLAFPSQADGSLIRVNDKVIGSKWIGQKFESPKYFWGRPSTTDYNPLPSGGSNAGPINADLKKVVLERAEKLGDNENTTPQLLLTASGSGLDPHLDLNSILFQVPRVAKARGVPEDEIASIVRSKIEPRQLGFLGEERINVLELNLALDARN